MCAISIVLFCTPLLITPFIGIEFFPKVDAEQLRLHVKASTGTRIELTEEIFGSVKAEIKKVIPPEEITMMIDNIGINPNHYNMAYVENANIGFWDGEILIALAPERKKSTFEYMEKLRDHLNSHFPQYTFYFQPSDLINQILNFGLPTPIDVRVIGH